MHKKLWPYLLVIILSFWAVKNLAVPGYFSMHDDLQAMRQLQMHKCIEEGQFPCRWVPDMGYEYGYPLFNYYPPMPYYVGEIFVQLGMSIIDSVKVLAFLGFILGALGMYVLSKEFWGKWGGIVSSVFLTYAPYHAVDLYVRGALNEFIAISWFPWIYWAIYKLIKTEKWKHVMWLAFFVAMLMLSHNPMLMIFAPTAILWAGFWVWNENKRKNSWKLDAKKLLKPFTKLFSAGALALGLAAFFTLPVIFEKSYSHVDSIVQGYFNYLAHFVAFQQLFLWKDWGYGASGYQLNDDMSFQIGHIHWVASLIALLAVWKFWKKKRPLSLMILLMFVITYGAAFMSHLRSSFLWDWFPFLEFLQFPWRWLSLVIFGVSLLAGSLVTLVSKFKVWQRIAIASVLVTGVIAYNYEYFAWDVYYPTMTDEAKFSGKSWEKQLTSSIFDYLPISAPLPPVSKPESDLLIMDGSGSFITVEKKADYQVYNLTLNDESVVRLNTFYFPEWRYWLSNGEAMELTEYDLHDELGVPEFEIPEGEYTLTAELEDTLVRKIGNWVSVLSWGLFAYFLGNTALSLRK